MMFKICGLTNVSLNFVNISLGFSLIFQEKFLWSLLQQNHRKHIKFFLNFDANSKIISNPFFKQTTNISIFVLKFTISFFEIIYIKTVIKNNSLSERHMLF